MPQETIPQDSRYVPFVQQPYCCVPTCLQMVAYKNKLPVLSQEYIGAKLGLVVPPEDAGYFYNVAVSEKPVVSSGYGTRIQDSDYSLETFLATEQWPLKVIQKLASTLTSESVLFEQLSQVEADQGDALICLQNDRGYGHVMVFDRLVSDGIRVIDPSPQHAKWRTLPVAEVYDRIQRHGDDNFGGLWVLERL